MRSPLKNDLKFINTKLGIKVNITLQRDGKNKFLKGWQITQLSKKNPETEQCEQDCRIESPNAHSQTATLIWPWYTYHNTFMRSPGSS